MGNEISILNEIEGYYKNIKICRECIAKSKKDKAMKRAESWDNAQGIAKEKEDYVKSQVADYEKLIDMAEAEIEYNYNMIQILQMKLEWIDE